jgi:Spy/CpxP family protein refolding chaperone
MAMRAKWLRLGAAFGLTLGMATVAAAGPGGPKGPERAKARVEKMKERLGLSDEQAQKIEAILAEAIAQGETDRGQARERRQQVRDKIQAVLTDEQKAKAAEQRQELRQRRHPRPAPPER